jgi:flagellar motor protein MotB
LFFSILAAAAVLIAYFRIQGQFDAWNAAIDERSAQVHDILKACHEASNNLMMAPSWRTSSSDFVDLSEETTIALRKVYSLNREMIALFSQKPFGLPLTAKEQSELESLRRSVGPSQNSEKEERPRTTEQAPAASQPAPSIATTPRPLPHDVVLTTPIQMPVIIRGKPSGAVTLPRGTRLQLVSVGRGSVVVRYVDSTATIPTSVTDLKLSSPQ